MSVFRFPECKECSFHDVEPAICEKCVKGSEFLDKLWDSEPINAPYFYEDREIE